MTNKLVENVSSFLTRASDIVGNFEIDTFRYDASSYCLEGIIKSPIEQMLYIAFEVLRKVNFIGKLKPITNIKGIDKLDGLGLLPQQMIGEYRVDFVATYGDPYSEPNERSLVVECDGHAFHDRSEPERRYEKQRDRFLQSKGYRIMHFTGAEINADPFKVAAEIINVLVDPLGKIDHVYGAQALRESLVNYE